MNISRKSAKMQSKWVHEFHELEHELHEFSGIDIKDF